MVMKLGGLGKDGLKRSIKRAKKIKLWQLAIALVLMLFLLATLLRLDNIGMSQRRDAVMSADKAGDETMLEERLLELKTYVFSHMNSDTGVFYLEYRYQRDAQAILDEAGKQAEETNPHGNIYKLAAEVCDPQYKMYSQAYFACMMNEIEKYPSSGELNDTITVELPNTELYRLSYASPVWTASWSGLVAVICVVILLVIVVRLVVTIVLKVILWRVKKSL